MKNKTIKEFQEAYEVLISDQHNNTFKTRQDSFEFIQYLKKQEILNLMITKFPFGKYKGTFLGVVYFTDRKYLEYISEKMSGDIAKKAKMLLEKAIIDE